jgi:hypothetical protein
MTSEEIERLRPFATRYVWWKSAEEALRYPESESLKALVYFEGGDLDLLTTREREVLIGAAQKVRDLPSVSWNSGLSIPEDARLFKNSPGWLKLDRRFRGTCPVAETFRECQLPAGGKWR